MNKINFINNSAPDLSAETLNQIQNNMEEVGVTVSPTEPTTNEKVWIKKGKNLFNKNSLSTGYRFGSDGLLFADSSYSSTDFILVNPNTSYIVNWIMETRECVCYYDENKTFISRNTTTKPFTTPSNCKYIRASVANTRIETAQIEQNTVSTTYEPYIEQVIYVKNDNGVYEEFINKEEDTGWIDLSLGEGVTSYEWALPKYRKAGKIVQVVGVINISSMSSGSTIIASLPYYPKTEVGFALRNTGGVGLYSLSTSGNLVPNFNGSNIDLWISFNYMTAD